MLTLPEFIHALTVGALVTWFLPLIQPGMPLQAYGRWLDRIEHTAPAWISWIAKPLGGCAFCFSFWAGVAWAIVLGLTPLKILLFACVVNFIQKIGDYDRNY